jgi:hypothetical protein
MNYDHNMVSLFQTSAAELNLLNPPSQNHPLLSPTPQEPVDQDPGDRNSERVRGYPPGHKGPFIVYIKKTVTAYPYYEG